MTPVPSHLRAAARFLAGLALLVPALACSRAVPFPAGPHPIVVVDVDSLRADHLGCYGYGRPTSPSVDALAREAVRFEWAFSAAPETGPAQASLLTGLYPTSHGLTADGGRLADGVDTLAELLKGRGYTTAAFVDGGFMSPELGLGQGFTTYESSRGGGLAEVGPKALEWLRAHARESFLLLVHTYDAHVPYAPREPYRGQLLAGVAPPSAGFEPSPERLEAVNRALAAGAPQPLPAADLAYTGALYDGEIRMVDAWVGELMAELRRLKLDRRATVVLVSDHGEELQEHGRLLHETLAAAVTRIPLLIRLPGGQKAGVVGKVVGGVDLAPTLLQLAGAPIPAVAQGRSLVPLILGASTPPYRALGESALLGGQRFAALDDYRLLLWKAGDRAELYNFREDPLEQHDLAATEEQRVQVLRRQLTTWEEEVARTTFGAGAAQPLGEDTLKQLKSLGYVQ
jgi:arylsulfatase A-like enzyme